MADLPESPDYSLGVYQIETTDPVVGGPTGESNKQAKDLANRTAWLKQQVDQLSVDLAALGVSQIGGLETALNNKLGIGEKAADTELLDGQDSRVYAPPGAVIAFAASTPPAGWLECNGALLSRTAYADLFAVVSTAFGAGDGSSTFNLPDLRGEFIRGFDHGRGIDDGRSLGSWQAPSLITASIGPGVIQDLIVEGSEINRVNEADFHEALQTDPVQDSDYGPALKGWAYGLANQRAYSGNSAGLTVDAHSGRAINTNPYFVAGGSRTRNIALMFCIKY